MMVKNLSSNLRCIKMLRTNDDFIAAMSSAIVTVSVQSEIRVTATDINVSRINPARTNKKVR